MTFDMDSIKDRLKPPVDRAFLIEIVANGMNISLATRGIAMALLSGLPQKDLDRYATIASDCLDCIKSGDTVKLKEVLTANKVPEQFVVLITSYLENVSKGGKNA